MKALVFVWTFKDVVGLSFIGFVVLYVAFWLIRYYVCSLIEDWKAKRNKNKKKEEEEQ